MRQKVTRFHFYYRTNTIIFLLSLLQKKFLIHELNKSWILQTFKVRGLLSNVTCIGKFEIQL